MRSYSRWLTLILIGLMFFGGGVGIARLWQRYETAMTPQTPAPSSPATEPVQASDGPLKVVRAFPEPGQVGVMRWSRLLLFFDRPVPQSALQAALALEPSLEMRFEPYGDCGWAISPPTGWAEGRLYSIRLGGQLAGASGAPLQHELAWSFRTAALPVPDDIGPGATWDQTLTLTAPVWSPDGRRLAAVKRGQDRFDWQLVAYEPAAGKQQVVGPADPASPVWLDDTRLVVSARGAQPGAGIELRQYDLARGIYRILASPTNLRQYAYTVSPHRVPGGGWLLEVNQGGVDAHSDISQSLATLSGSGGMRWLDEPAGTKWFLGWDSSGRALLLNTFADYDNSHSFRYDIMAWELTSGKLTTLAGDGPIASYGGAAQNGDDIALWTWTAVDTGHAIEHRPARLLRYRIKDNELLDIKPQVPKSSMPATDMLPMPMCWQDAWPSWSPDGSRLAFTSNRGGSWDIWTMKPDGSDARRLTTDDGEDTHPAWSPDGRTIAFLSTRNGSREIWLMDADGANQRPVR